MKRTNGARSIYAIALNSGIFDGQNELEFDDTPPTVANCYHEEWKSGYATGYEAAWRSHWAANDFPLDACYGT